ncbi:MAG: DegT/DnrJ/EryC1/StrS family aminotransferase [Pirellulales bacterium]
MSQSDRLPSVAAGPAAAGVPLFDSKRQHLAIADEISRAIDNVCKSGRYVLGPECQELERAIATYSGAAHAVSCASGSDALLLALMACNVGPGDEVLLPSYTFFATASAVWRLGARPVFVDIDPETYLIDPAHLAAQVTPACKAVIPVHLYGQCADMPAILKLAEQHQLTVIEDAAQAIGAELHGRQAGAWGDMGCFSFYPTKNLGCLGDGGLLTARDANVADRLTLLRGHGMRPRYHHQIVGINSRLDTVQAAILLAKLPHLKRWTEQRTINAARYVSLFTDFGLDRVLGLPAAAPGSRHVWNQYIIRVPDGHRDALQKHLAERQIGTEIYYPVPLHQQACFQIAGQPYPALPETERAARETLALPIFPELAAAEQTQVVREIASFFATRQARATPLPRPKFVQHDLAARQF